MVWQGYLRVAPAPSPSDIYWPNLHRSKERQALFWWLGAAATAALFLFFTVPVAAVQGLASINQLAKLKAFNGLAREIKRQGPEAVAFWEVGPPPAAPPLGCHPSPSPPVPPARLSLPSAPLARSSPRRSPPAL